MQMPLAYREGGQKPASHKSTSHWTNAWICAWFKRSTQKFHICNYKQVEWLWNHVNLIFFMFSPSAQFNRALDVMNQAVSSPGEYLQPGAKEHIAYLTSIERRWVLNACHNACYKTVSHLIIMFWYYRKEAEAAAATAALERQRVSNETRSRTS